MIIRKADKNDFEKIFAITESCKVFLAENGVEQWNDGYPTKEIIRSDIENGLAYVVVKDERVVAYFALTVTDEEDYRTIYDGNWLTDGKMPYLTVHRTAVADGFRGCGIGKTIFGFAESYAKENGIGSVRVDTHADNKIMRRVIGQNMFSYCGVIYIDKLLPRVAYEKVL